MVGVDFTGASHRHPAGGHRLLVLVDVAVAVLLCGGLLLADTRTGGHHAGTVGDRLRTAGIVVAAATVAVRRLAPRTTFTLATIAATVVASLGGAPQTSICIAMTAYAAASACEHARWWIPPAAASVAIASGVSVGRVSDWPAALLATIAIVCVGWFAGQAALERRHRLLTLADRQGDRVRQHAAELRQAAIDERLVIARELHDIVAHAMSVIAVRAGVARVVMDDDPGEVRNALGIIETTTRQALHEMRLLVAVLRQEDVVDRALAPAPGLAEIPALAEQIRLTGVELSLDVHGCARALPPGVDLSAYRIAQEALTNIVRHAGPTRATLLIDYGTDQLTIDVTDAGPLRPRTVAHTEPRSGAGHGLIGMGERVALYDGQLVTGRHGAGYRVHALLRTGNVSS